MGTWTLPCGEDCSCGPSWCSEEVPATLTLVLSAFGDGECVYQPPPFEGYLRWEFQDVINGVPILADSIVDLPGGWMATFTIGSMLQQIYLSPGCEDYSGEFFATGEVECVITFTDPDTYTIEFKLQSQDIPIGSGEGTCPISSPTITNLDSTIWETGTLIIS